MSERIKKINKHIHRVFGEILLKDTDLPKDILMTVARVETTPNLKSCTIWLYVSPIERGEEVIENLTPQLYDLQGALNRELHLKMLPRIILRLDHGAAYADKIERKFAELE